MFFLSGVAKFLFRAAGRGGDFRHAGVVYVVANDRADARDVPFECRRRVQPGTSQRGEAGYFFGACNKPLSTLSNVSAKAIATRSMPRWQVPGCLPASFLIFLRSFRRDWSLFWGADFFPKVDAGQIRLHFPRTHWPAY